MKACTEKGFPGLGAFQRSGSKEDRARDVIEYCKSRAGYEDVVAMCAPALSVAPSPNRKVEPHVAVGDVYLMKSGRYYKIGRTNAVGRREYEIAIQMPEKLSTAHTIRTDDTVGIEASWRTRFESRRKNGEWFDLERDDVLAFRRRNFM